MIASRAYARPAAALVLALASIVAFGPARDATGAPSQPMLRRGGTLVATMSSEPLGNFDPLRQADTGSSTIMTNVLEPLVRLDEQLRPVPWLARAFEQPDPQTYVFKLRTGVRFHDGTTMDAESVKFSIDRIRADPAAPEYAVAQSIVESEVVDAETYLIRVREPYAPFLNRLTGRLGTVVSPTAVRAEGNEPFNRNPVGTGPFRSIRYEPGRTIRVERFDDYWRAGEDGRPLPYLDAIEWRVIADPRERVAALLAGDTQITDTPVGLDDLLRADPSITIAYDATGGFGYSGFMLTLDRPPFDNPALRQAVAFALDRDAINDFWYGGACVVAHGPVPPAIAWAVDPSYRPYTYDPVSALLKLQEGGHPNGFSFEIWALESEAELMELIAVQLAGVGIVMRARLTSSFATLVERAQRRESNAYFVGFTTGTDPDPAISRYLPGDFFNLSPYDNPRVTALALEARRTFDLEQRGALYRQITPLIMGDSPYIFFFASPLRFVGSRRVQGWTLGVRATTGYSEYWLMP